MKTGKAALRGVLRRQRRALSGAEHAARSRKAQRAIARLHRFAAGSRIAVYLPVDREADTALLIAAARRRRLRIFVPVVADRRHRVIKFHPLSRRLRRGAYGIAVPAAPSRPVGARWLDLVVVPLVGVDGAGHRLGMGGGFYDRAFAFRWRRSAWRGPLMIGLAFDCQRVDSIGAEHWDLRLDALATESGLIGRCRRRR
ncbi:MAG TPA: 5-formyltetrahydrofolate cyclo-ligase [Steroidobacteraceae bacterium]|nr:5-formyltetrahydrofolate cyclo-ligase [Steroidobacteraceae bacterium]